jgi:hypothetical protein
MRLDTYKKLFVAIGLIGVLVFSSPTLAILIKPPSGQPFSEIYVLGPNHTLDNIPFNVEGGIRYLIYLGVTNELGYSSYYRIYVKFGNQYDSLPNITLGLPSTLPALYEYNLFIKDRDAWQAPFTFEVSDLSVVNGASTLSVMALNGLDYSINKISYWDPNKSGYYYTLILELWAYNATAGILEYNNRFVSLALNMTSIN